MRSWRCGWFGVSRSTRTVTGTVAACSVDGTDLAQWLVSHGHALDWPRYSKGKYAADQRAAEQAGLGIWAGSFAAPWQYRDCVRARGKSSKCPDE
ncbi:hypothetical protein BraRD5C2_46630 [Bradyrhizobium sp. RD5-C2]|nr:hypothetical protein BraRD5C2_46630 [Bradyrhizobium sp. RD5-C2]